MNAKIHIRAATPADLERIKSLLQTAGLPLAGLPGDGRDFFVAETDGAVCGAIGLEHYGQTALLRSLVTAPASRSRGIGNALTQHIILHARMLRVRSLYLVTTTAVPFFAPRGFQEVRHESVAGAILNSVEFTGACPSSATVMLLRLRPSILVLCTGNSCRSQMAEGFIRSFDPDLEVFSAGTNPARAVHPQALRVMAEAGVPLTDAMPKHVDLFLNRSFDHVVTVCDDANETCPVFTGKVLHRHHLGFPDPAQASGTPAEILAEFRRTRDAIRDRFERFVREEC